MSDYKFDQEYELSDLVFFVTDKIESDEVTLDTYISTENMLTDRRGVITATKLSSSPRFNNFKSGDTLFSNIRTYFKKVWLAGFEGGASPDVLIFRTKNTDVLDPNYLYFLLSSDEFINYTDLTSKGAKMPRGDKAAIMQYTFVLPEKERQLQISTGLLKINEKIKLNRQTKQVLEQITQAIFKSWFVDFEPTHAKIIAKKKGASPATQKLAAQAVICGAITLGQLEKIEQNLESTLQQAINEKLSQDNQTASNAEQLKVAAALFPNALVESGLGEIPNGWEVKSFGEVSQCFDSMRIPLSKRKREEMKPGNIPYYGATSVMDYINEWVFDDIYLLLGEDGSVSKDDGTPFVQYIWGKAWVNNHAHVLQGRNGVSTEQLMIFMQSQNITAYITGAVQAKLNQRNMNSIPFLDAGESINNIFYELIESFYEQIRLVYEANQTLEELRDTILPKLLSGELKPEAAE